MNAKEVAGLTGVSVRTLHHYDQIGLLCPGRNRDNGYRTYRDEDLDTLQQILLFKACGFTLSQIRAMLQNPQFSREEAFALQKKTLLYEKERLDAMLNTLEQSMETLKGERNMTQNEKFAGLSMQENPYEDEARRLWGDDAVDQSNAYIQSLSGEEQQGVAQGMDALFSKLAGLRTLDPAGAQAQQAMAGMYAYMNSNFGFHYTHEAFAGLGQLYVADERFTRNIDQYGEGLSQFLAQAMGIYAKRQQEGQ